MLVAYFLVAAILALSFLGTAGLKLVRSKDALAASGLGWTESFSQPQIRMIGVLEALGAIGLIVPMATGIAPVLSPIAAVGLLAIMAGAAVVHVRRREWLLVVVTVVLAGLSIVAAVLGFAMVFGGVAQS